MKTKILMLIALVTIVVGCNKDKSSTPAVVEPKEEGFKFSINVLAKKNDTFSLYYTEDGTSDFNGRTPIWLDVKGSDTPQDVVFTLPADANPTQFRIDMAKSQDQEPIIINGFEMSYLGKSFKAGGDQFYIYFDPDLSKTVFDKETRTVTAVVKNGVKETPSFYPNTKPLGDEIKKLMQ